MLLIVASIGYFSLIIYNIIMYTSIIKRKKFNIILIVFVVILSGCYDNTQMPDDLDFIIYKYPHMKSMYDEFSSRNLDPNSIDIKSDVEENEFPNFIQWDKRWAYLPYIDSYMAVKGNIPTALSSIYTYLTKNTTMNPYEMAQFFEKEGWGIDSMGTSWQAIEIGSIRLGLTYNVVANNDVRINDELDRGRVLLASVVKGVFTKDSGMIIIYKKVGDKYYISDPLNKENSEKTWSLEDLQNQMIHIWSFSKMEAK